MDRSEIDWSWYEIEKIKLGLNPEIFNCQEKWEREFLIQVIKELHPHLDTGEIWRIIMAICKVKFDATREEFSAAVLKRLLQQ